VLKSRTASSYRCRGGPSRLGAAVCERPGGGSASCAPAQKFFPSEQRTIARQRGSASRASKALARHSMSAVSK
jgi:hypothetical protein